MLKLTKSIKKVGNLYQVKVDISTFNEIKGYTPEIPFDTIPTNKKYDARKFNIDGHDIYTYYDATLKEKTSCYVNEKTFKELFDENEETLDLAAFIGDEIEVEA